MHGNHAQKLPPTPAGEWVTVKRDALELILECYGGPDEGFQNEVDAYNHLRAALGTGGKEE